MNVAPDVHGSRRLIEFLATERLEQLLAAFPALNISVIGDVGLDAYWTIDMTRARLSRETPRFPRPVVRETYGPGAGANVAQNLKALGVGEVSIFSVVGQDMWAATLQAELSSRDIRLEGLLASPERRTTTYVKPLLMGYNSQQEDARLDFENVAPLSGELEERLVSLVEARLSELHALLVTDQLEEYGVITERARQKLNALAGSHPQVQFLVDSRLKIDRFEHMVLKPNWIEAMAAVYTGRDPRLATLEELASAGRALSQRSGHPAYVTLSEQGVLVCTGEHYEPLPAAPVRPPLDPVGAGDAFLAALGAALAAGASAWEAGAVANLAAAVTVEKLGQTGTASPGEILERHALAREAGA